MKYSIILLNYGLFNIEGKTFTKLECSFAKKDMYVESKKVNGVVPFQIFILGDYTDKLSINDVYQCFDVEGEMITDPQKPMNKKFKPIKLINTMSKNVINLSK